jgi:hypothetical protein
MLNDFINISEEAQRTNKVRRPKWPDGYNVEDLQRPYGRFSFRCPARCDR